MLLPIAPFTETSGTFVNAEGRVQSFHGVVKPLGEARPAWKVLRVLGNLLGLPGFAFETVGRRAAPTRSATATRSRRASRNGTRSPPSRCRAPPAAGLERIADVPIYSADPLVRRAPSLQLTADARPPRARVPAQLLAELGIADGDAVRVSQGAAQVVLDGARRRHAGRRRACASPPAIR